MAKKVFRNILAFCSEYKSVIQKIFVVLITGISPYFYQWGVFQDHPFLCSIAGLCVVVAFFLLLYMLTHGKFNFNNDNFCYYTITSRLPSIYKKYTGENWTVKDPINESTLWDSNRCSILPKNSQLKNSQKYNELYRTLVGEKLEGFTSLEEVFQNVDFLTAEHYFYYLLYKKFRENRNDLCAQFSGTERDIAEHDPYYKTKMDSLQEEPVKKSLEKYGNCNITDLSTLLIHGVGANTSDLSQEGAHSDVVNEPHIKPNESDDVNKYVEKLEEKRQKGGKVKVDILTDNCGLELLSDIELAVFLLKNGLSDSVVFHVRVLPQYVSDVTKNMFVDDFEQLLGRLEDMKSEGMDDFGLLADVRKYMKGEQICVKEDLFWNLPTYYYKHKAIFTEIIGTSDLVIVKGDLNYRKLVGDKDYYSLFWFRYRVRKIGYPVLALRAIKSSLVDVGSSLKKRKTRRNIIHNINGLNGDYGVIRFYDGSNSDGGRE